MEEKNIATEIKIKEIARKLFYEKGYAATRTRDIAEEAGVNIALLNYYFRSKEKLFNTIMLESIKEIFMLLQDIINDKSTPLLHKIELAVNKYIDILTSNPHLPLFVLSEIRNNTEGFIKKIKVPKNLLYNSYMFKQMQEQIDKNNLPSTPLHIVVNIASMSIMPIAAKDFMGYLYNMTDDDYLEFVDQRRTLIPLWIKSILRIED